MTKRACYCDPIATKTRSDMKTGESNGEGQYKHFHAFRLHKVRG